MAEQRPPRYTILWTKRANGRLMTMLEDTRQADSDPEWIFRMYERCLDECDSRLATFPDMRVRFAVSGIPCSGLTLMCFPVQVFYRLFGYDQIRIFACRWARQDISGPSR